MQNNPLHYLSYYYANTAVTVLTSVTVTTMGPLRIIVSLLVLGYYDNSSCPIDPSHVEGPVLSGIVHYLMPSLPPHNHGTGRTETNFTQMAKPQSHLPGLPSSKAMCPAQSLNCPVDHISSHLLRNVSHSRIFFCFSLSFCMAHQHIRILRSFPF